MRQRLADLLQADGPRLALLRQVRALALPDAWIGAGFVRNAVWDMLAGRPPRLPADIDVIWFDRARAQPLRDTALERRLARTGPPAPWSVKNQSRMHARNQDAPYACCGDALRAWPETATAVAVRLDAFDRIEILAPLGLDDLFAGIVRPTPRFRGAKHVQFQARLQDKQGWRSGLSCACCPDPRPDVIRAIPAGRRYEAKTKQCANRIMYFRFCCFMM